MTDTGTLLWNGEQVGPARMQQLLNVGGSEEAHLRPDPRAPYGRVDELLAMAGKAEVDRLGFVGNEVYADF